MFDELVRVNEALLPLRAGEGVGGR